MHGEMFCHVKDCCQRGCFSPLYSILVEKPVGIKGSKYPFNFGKIFAAQEFPSLLNEGALEFYFGVSVGCRHVEK